MSTFKRGDLVQKKQGSNWRGRVCGEYSTSITPEGYAVESMREPGNVQIYPVAALIPWEGDGGNKTNPVIHWTPAMDRRLTELRDKGHTYAECSDAIGVCIGVVAARCKALGINQRMSRGRWRGTTAQNA